MFLVGPCTTLTVIQAHSVTKCLCSTVMSMHYCTAQAHCYRMCLNYCKNSTARSFVNTHEGGHPTISMSTTGSWSSVNTHEGSRPTISMPTTDKATFYFWHKVPMVVILRFMVVLAVRLRFRLLISLRLILMFTFP